MKALQVTLVILCALLMGAHGLRAGHYVLVGLSLACPLLLMWPHPRATQLLQVALVLAAAEWIRTLVRIAALRQAQEAPWGRMAIILGTVAALNGLAVVVLRLKTR